jgi:hypothetical protein
MHRRLEYVISSSNGFYWLGNLYRVIFPSFFKRLEKMHPVIYQVALDGLGDVDHCRCIEAYQRRRGCVGGHS